MSQEVVLVAGREVALAHGAGRRRGLVETHRPTAPYARSRSSGGPSKPAYAGAVSGVLSTAQQVGNALGVAVVGMVFFGAVGGGYAHALEWSLVVLAGTTTAVAVLGMALGRRTDAEADAEDGLVMVGA